MQIETTTYEEGGFLKRLRTPNPKRHGGIINRSRMISVGLLAASLALSFVIVEFGARRVFHKTPLAKACTMRHPETIFTLKPRAVGQRRLLISPDACRTSEVRISSQGLRDHEYGPKAPGEQRIVMIGDSYVMGGATEIQDTIPKTLENLMAQRMPGSRFSVVNGGVGGYAPWQERIFLRERCFPIQPDMVILQLFPQNDINGTLDRIGKSLRAYNEHWWLRLQAYRLPGPCPIRAFRWLHARSRACQVLWETLGGDTGMQDIWNRLFFVPAYDLPAPPPNEDRPYLLETELAEWYPELTEGFELMIADVQAIHNDCVERGIPICVYCIPSMECADPRRWHELEAAMAGRTSYERGKSLQLISQALKERGIPYVDVAGVLIDHPRVEELYFPYDGHLSEAGNRVVAESLMDYLLAHGLPGAAFAGDGEEHAQ